MNANTIELITSEAQKLLAAPSASAAAKEAAEKWLAAADKEAASIELKKSLMASIATVDELIAFAGSPACEDLMGKETADGLLAHGKDIKAKGALFCDCPACSACYAIIQALE